MTCVTGIHLFVNNDSVIQVRVCGHLTYTTPFHQNKTTKATSIVTIMNNKRCTACINSTQFSSAIFFIFFYFLLFVVMLFGRFGWTGLNANFHKTHTTHINTY